MVTDIKFSELEDKQDYLFIDVRSEKEFFEATIPGAVNVPLFNNDERAIIGTVYKEQGPEKARELGLQIVSPKIPSLIEQVKVDLKPDKIPVFFCWRGGMRSKSMAIFYDLIYPNVYRLDGGYRLYREYILTELSKLDIHAPTFVLHGVTGVGKTMILHKLNDMGITIIDLEGFAGHRGSVFGAVGELLPANQKKFDSYIYNAIKEIRKADAVVMEAESKRIGRIVIPDNIMKAKEEGMHILVNASLTNRINRIFAEYKPHDNKEAIYEGIKKIEKRLPTEIREEIYDSLEKNDFRTVIELLLIYYYDPRYNHATTKYNSAFYEVNADNINEAVIKIYNFIQNTVKNNNIVLTK